MGGQTVFGEEIISKLPTLMTTPSDKKSFEAFDLSEKEMDIFSDPQSKLAMMKRVIITRMTPLLIIFFLMIIPNLFLFVMNYPRFGTAGVLIALVYLILFVEYVSIFIYCIRGFIKLKNKYKE